MATTWRAKTPIGEDAAQKAYKKNWANMSQSKQETMDKITAARDEADNEVKRESRGIPKPANFDAMQESIQDAKDAKDRKKISDMGYKKGGMTASKRADGIATKGKTRGTMITMKGGGYAC
jgi:hypothetical protein